MKLSINKNTLESAITLCNAYVDKKDSSAITSHLLFEASDDKLIIKASDYEFGLTYKIKKIKIEKEGFATVHAKNIVDMIKNLNNEDITLETVENSQNISLLCLTMRISLNFQILRASKNLTWIHLI